MKSSGRAAAGRHRSIVHPSGRGRPRVGKRRDAVGGPNPLFALAPAGSTRPSRGEVASSCRLPESVPYPGAILRSRDKNRPQRSAWSRVASLPGAFSGSLSRQ